MPTTSILFGIALIGYGASFGVADTKNIEHGVILTCENIGAQDVKRPVKYEVASPPSVESLPRSANRHRAISLVESRTQAEDHRHQKGKGKA